jgi:hypothetical protein
MTERTAYDSAVDDAIKTERERCALLCVYHGPCPDCSGDCGSANPPVVSCIMQAARAALEYKL